MTSFVALIRGKNNRVQEAKYTQLKEAFRQSHLDWPLCELSDCFCVFHECSPAKAEGPLHMTNDSGLVIGTLFPNVSNSSLLASKTYFDASQTDAIVKTRGRHLTDCFWGSYVAFIRPPTRASSYILRDCSGKIPCFVMTYSDTSIVFSNLNDLAHLGLPKFSINGKYLAGFLYEPELAQRDCAVNEVSEVLAGECIEIDNGRSTHFALWDPRVICRKPKLEDFNEASRQIAKITQACIDSWASRYDRIVHQLSGGLDSSVILGCLKNSPYCPDITCLHLETSGADGSEAQFARLVAEANDTPLVIQPGYSSQARYDERIFDLYKSPKPSVSSLAMTLDYDARNQVPKHFKADAVWDGQGGDHLFFQSSSAFGAVDYAFNNGVLGAYLAHARSSVKRSRQSIWGVLAKSLSLGVLRASWRPEDEYNRLPVFTNPAVLPRDLRNYVWQPWLEDAEDIAPGKRWQICMLAGLLHRHRPVPELEYVGEHHPLFSQPLVELCLTIPIYTLLQGGTDRALERHAFAHCVPERIIRRVNKGTTTTTIMAKIRDCLPFLRDLLLDGVLVRERILNRETLEPYLISNKPMNWEVYWPFMASVAAETWARRWESDRWLS